MKCVNTPYGTSAEFVNGEVTDVCSLCAHSRFKTRTDKHECSCVKMRISLRMTCVYMRTRACAHATSCKSNKHDINDDDNMKRESAFGIAT
jgi:hypothetical protein